MDNTEKVARLVTLADPHRIVEMLEDLITRAKAGEFESVLCVLCRPDRTFTTCSSGTRSISDHVWMLETLKHDAMHRSIEVGQP